MKNQKNQKNTTATAKEKVDTPYKRPPVLTETQSLTREGERVKNLLDAFLNISKAIVAWTEADLVAFKRGIPQSRQTRLLEDMDLRLEELKLKREVLAAE